MKLKLGYFFLDWIIERELNKFFNLNRKQKRKAKTIVQDYKKWHRRTMLRKYCEALKSWKGMVEQGFDYSSAKKIYLELLADTYGGLIRLSEALIYDLDIKQKKLFKERLVSQNQRHKLKYFISEDQLIEKHRERLSKYLVQATGEITSGQKEMLSSINEKDLYPYQSWMRHREEQQVRLIKLIDQRVSLNDIERFMKNWVLEEDIDRNLHSDIQSYDETLNNRINELIRSLSPGQRQFFSKRVEEYIGEIESLIR